MTSDQRINTDHGVIFHVVDSLRLGGAERLAVDFSNGLAAAGWTVHLVVTRETGPLAEDVHAGVRVHILNRSSRWDLAGVQAFRALLREHRPVLVHTHGWSTVQFVTAAMIGLRRPVPIVLHDHGGARYQRFVRLYKLVAWPFVRAHLAVWRTLLDPPMPTRRSLVTAVVPNSVPLERIAAKTSVAWNDPVRSVVVANVRPQKDHLGLLRALAILRDQGVHLETDIVGAIPDPDHAAHCEQLLGELALGDRVRFQGRQVGMGARLPAYDLGIICARTESGPIALIEYMAAGLPFVTTDVGEIPALLPESLRSCTVPAADPAALAAGITRALALNEAERRVLADRGRAVASSLSLPTAVRTIEGLYHQVMANCR